MEKTPEEITAARQEMIQQYELCLNNIGKEIERLDQMDVDLDDEGDSSAYIRKCQLQGRYIQFYKELCRATGCSYLTGRPIEKKIILTGVTPFTQLNEKVAQYMNNQSISFVPDFNDVLNVVQHENQGSADPPVIPQTEISATAKKLHRRIIDILRSRRYQDFHISLPAPPIAITAKESSVNDPADSDENLRKKLEANRKTAIKENQVVANFFKKAETSVLKANDCELNADEDTDEESSGDDDSDSRVHSRFDGDEAFEDISDD